MPRNSTVMLWTDINASNGSYTEIVGAANKFFRVQQ
jgi:hypothetical protein